MDLPVSPPPPVCTWLYILKITCESNSTAQMSLSLGNALSTLALLATFLNYTTPIHRFRREVRKVWRRVGIALIAIMFVASFIAFMLRVLYPAGSGHPSTIFELTVFWEGCGSLAAAWGIAILVWTLLVPVEFRLGNCHRYKKACIKVLCSHDPEPRAQLAQELSYSAAGLARHISGSGTIAREEALRLVEMLSLDSAFMLNLAEKYPHFVHVFLLALAARFNAQNSNSELAPQVLAFVTAFSRACFESDESIMQKEVEQHRRPLRIITPRPPLPNYPADSMTVTLFGSTLFWKSALNGWVIYPGLGTPLKPNALLRYREAISLVILSVLPHPHLGLSRWSSENPFSEAGPTALHVCDTSEVDPAKRDNKSTQCENIIFQVASYWMLILSDFNYVYRLGVISPELAEALWLLTARFLAFTECVRDYRYAHPLRGYPTPGEAFLTNQLESAFVGYQAIVNGYAALSYRAPISTVTSFSFSPRPQTAKNLSVSRFLLPHDNLHGMRHPKAVIDDFHRVITEHFSLWYFFNQEEASIFLPENFKYDQAKNEIVDAERRHVLPVNPFPVAKQAAKAGTIHLSNNKEMKDSLVKLLTEAKNLNLI